jgi:hypothetical protein
MNARPLPYLDPPADETPGVIAKPGMLTEHDDAAISVEQIRVHSTGLLVTFAVRMPTAPSVGSDLEREWWSLLREERREAAATGILLGYRHASGSVAIHDRRTTGDFPRDQATAPISLQSGRNRGRDGTATYWHWPLPEGDITFFGRWQTQGLPYGCVTIPAMRLAAARPTSP